MTSTITPDTAPNDVFVDDPAFSSDRTLSPPLLTVSSALAQVSFRNFYNLESGFDGGVLEVSSPNINGGAFTDVTDPAVGGSFVSGGYNGVISDRQWKCDCWSRGLVWQFGRLHRYRVEPRTEPERTNNPAEVSHGLRQPGRWCRVAHGHFHKHRGVPEFNIDTNTDTFYSHSYRNRHGNTSRFADTYSFRNSFRAQRQFSRQRGMARSSFKATRTGNYDLFVMDADGANPINLTNEPSFDYYAAWSPDGTKIAFSSDRDGNIEIYVMNADGSNPIRLTTDPADDLVPRWSPDGTKFAFYSNRDGNYEIYVMDADGSNQTRLTNTPADEFDPAWSPDGGQIVFDEFTGWQQRNLPDGCRRRQSDQPDEQEWIGLQPCLVA